MRRMVMISIVMFKVFAVLLDVGVAVCPLVVMHHRSSAALVVGVLRVLQVPNYTSGHGSLTLTVLVRMCWC